jgi:TfoX/Sxy family transcriptional regulator of competence genes
MAYDESAAERVRRALSSRCRPIERKMMGGICFMVDGNMCCGVTASSLMVRVGRETYDAMLAQPHVRPLQFSGRRAMGFVLVDADGFATDAALATWIGRAVAFVSTLPAKEPVATPPRRNARPG